MSNVCLADTQKDCIGTFITPDSEACIKGGVADKASGLIYQYNIRILWDSAEHLECADIIRCVNT